MITIFSGDNIVASRKAFIEYKNNLRHNNVDCEEIPLSKVSDLESVIHGTASLFNERRVFTMENVLSKKKHREAIKKCIDDSSVNIVIWEGSMDDRSLKRYFPKAKYVISKLPSNLWQFLDSVYPGNARRVISDMKSLQESVDIHMILYMLQRRIKDLILAENGQDGKRKLAGWQLQNMQRQSGKWGRSREGRTKSLKKMYSKLYEIEARMKSSPQPYELDETLDIVFSFYLA